jgi:hypothetical protein
MKERINEMIILVYWAILMFCVLELVINKFKFSDNKYIRYIHKSLLFILIIHVSIKVIHDWELDKYINIYCMSDKTTPGIDEIKIGVNEVKSGVNESKIGINESKIGINESKIGINEVKSGVLKSKLGVNEGTIYIKNKTNNNYRWDKPAMLAIFMSSMNRAVQKSGLSPIGKLCAYTGASLGALGVLSMGKEEKAKTVIKKTVFKNVENSGKEEDWINVDEELMSKIEIMIEGMTYVNWGILMQMQSVYYFYLWDIILTVSDVYHDIHHHKEYK